MIDLAMGGDNDEEGMKKLYGQMNEIKSYGTTIGCFLEV